MTNKISVVIATKDRPDDLRKALESLRLQIVRPDEVIVVDGSVQPIEPVLSDFPDLLLRYIRHMPPSASAQRNAGIHACDPSATLICLADDDILFEPQAFENMLTFWSAAAPDILGAAFNLRNFPDRGHARLKHSALTEWLGLYSPTPGSVAPSGWQTVIAELARTQYVDWLPTTAVTFRREVFKQQLFDEAFESYSYLEDLDFSYSVRRLGRLAVVADAGYRHFPSPSGRVLARQFGRYEVSNRLHFVRKHRLSVPRCYLGLGLRLAMSLGSSFLHRNASLFSRALGNVEALVTRGSARPGGLV